MLGACRKQEQGGGKGGKRPPGIDADVMLGGVGLCVAVVCVLTESNSLGDGVCIHGIYAHLPLWVVVIVDNTPILTTYARASLREEVWGESASREDMKLLHGNSAQHPACVSCV